MAFDFKIIITLEDLCAWAPINNSFAGSRKDDKPGRWWGDSEKVELHKAKLKLPPLLQAQHRNPDLGMPFWRGGLIQLGRYKTAQDQKHDVLGDMEPLLAGISFCKGEVKFPYFQNHEIGEIKNGIDPLWINIVPKENKLGRDVPITLGEAEGLLSQKGKPFSLHDFLTPYPGGITFWYDVESGYSVKVRQDAHKQDAKIRKAAEEAKHHFQYGSHNQYEFTLTDGPYDVFIHRNWQVVDKLKGPDGGGIDKIVVAADEKHQNGGGHGTHMDLAEELG